MFCWADWIHGIILAQSNKEGFSSDFLLPSQLGNIASLSSPITLLYRALEISDIFRYLLLGR